MNTNFKDIGLNRLGIKSESTAPEVDALTTRPSELLITITLCCALHGFINVKTIGSNNSGHKKRTKVSVTLLIK